MWNSDVRAQLVRFSSLPQPQENRVGIIHRHRYLPITWQVDNQFVRQITPEWLDAALEKPFGMQKQQIMRGWIFKEIV